MEIPRFLWLGATTAVIGVLVMLIALQTPAARSDLAPRQPVDGRLNMPQCSEAAPHDQQRLHLGTDLGVMVSIDGGNTWMTEETGFRRWSWR
jgi:hypothetical protein